MKTYKGLMNDDSHIMRHLYWETSLESKEYALHGLVDLLYNIAVVKDRNKRIVEWSEEYLGRAENGNIRCTREDHDRYNHNRAVIARLKRMYNYKLSKLKPFK